MAHQFKIRRGAVASLTAQAAGIPSFTNDQFRLYVSDGANRLVGLFHKIDGTAAPGVNDDAGDGFSVGSTWIDATADKCYTCVDSTVGAAVWKETGASGGIGSQPAASVYGNAASVAALPSAIVALNNGEVLRRNLGELEWSQIDFTNIAPITAGRLVGSSSLGAGSLTEIDFGGGGELMLNGDHLGITPNGVTNAMLRQSIGKSIMGRSANSVGNVADIAASATDDIMNFDGSTVAFRQPAIKSSVSDTVGSDYTTTTTMAATGAAVSCGAGTWVFIASVPNAVTSSSGNCTHNGQIWNSTDGVAVVGTTVINFANSFNSQLASCLVSAPYTIASGTKTVQLRAQRAGGGTFTAGLVYAEAVLTAIRIY